MTEHKHAEVLRAIADGKEVEYRVHAEDIWRLPIDFNPIAQQQLQWRIKPEVLIREIYTVRTTDKGEEHMNEQIKQLWVQAAEKTQGDSWEEQTKFIERFAELIVLECMRMCEVTEMSFVTHNCDVEASGAITVRQFIAEHFGVGDIPAPSKPS